VFQRSTQAKQDVNIAAISAHIQQLLKA
jgi:hypothetical protein